MSAQDRSPVAIVTGAARGIGRACAEALASAGIHVVVSDVLDCREATESIRRSGATAEAHRCDVAREQDVIDMFSRSIDAAGRTLDYLVHGAGVLHEASLTETSADEFDRVVSVNLRGTFLVGREALRRMQRAGHGRVVLIASDLGQTGRPGLSGYVASKHGVIGLARTWALEFAPGIQVNAVCPGPIDTDMLRRADVSEASRAKDADIPLKRPGRPEEVAMMVAYLCGPGGAFITGQALGVNGGSVLA